jgi:hypothetical protein
MRFLTPILILLVLQSCKTLEPIEPVQSLKTIPEIGDVYSTVSIPIEISLKDQLQDVENSLPKTFEGSQKQCEGVSYDYKFYRQPIDFDFRSSSIYYEVNGKFQINLNYCPSCVFLFGKETCTVPRIYASCGMNGESLRKVTVAYNSEISLMSNYKFRSKTELKTFQIHDPCEITVFRYDVTDKLKKEVKKELQKLEKDIDLQIESINVKAQLNNTWNELYKPISIDKFGFLYLNPKAISISQLDFEKMKVNLNLNLKIAPFVSTNPTSIEKTSLPNLEEYQKERGLNMTLDIRASYDSLNSYMNKVFKGNEFEIKNKKIIVEKLEVFGTQDAKMLLKMTFGGAKKGVLYLIGKPILDPENQKISLAELEFDIKTKSLLLKSAKWLFNNRIIEEIKKMAMFDITPLIFEAKSSINNELNGEITKGVFMNGKIKDIFIKELFLDSKNLIIRTNFKGELKLKIE